jgi:hypothetical protein
MILDRTKLRYLLGILGVLVIVLLVVLLGVRGYITRQVAERPAAAVSSYAEVTVAEANTLAEEPESEQLAPLDGRRIPAELATLPIAIMVENHPTARPQMRGLPEASIVYEALAEGGITRFMAVFDYQRLTRVGPVRSARPYYVDWAEEYAGAYVHAGGSHAALDQLVRSALADFDEDGTLLYRDFRYSTPHNLFADLAGLRMQLNESAHTSKLAGEWFDFSGRVPSTAVPASTLALDFSFPSYLVQYTYDSAADTYARKLAGLPHVDALGTPVAPTNIIVQFTDYYPIDDEGRLELTSVGSGKAWYFSGGRHWTGRWTRLRTGRTQFFTELGEAVSLSPGQTFVEVIQSPSSVTWQ